MFQCPFQGIFPLHRRDHGHMRQAPKMMPALSGMAWDIKSDINSNRWNNTVNGSRIHFMWRLNRVNTVYFLIQFSSKQKDGEGILQPLSKNGFWFKIKRDSSFKPKPYACMSRIWNPDPTQRLGQKTFFEMACKNLSLAAHIQMLEIP